MTSQRRTTSIMIMAINATRRRLFSLATHVMLHMGAASAALWHLRMKNSFDNDAYINNNHNMQ